MLERLRISDHVFLLPIQNQNQLLTGLDLSIQSSIRLFILREEISRISERSNQGISSWHSGSEDSEAMASVLYGEHSRLSTDQIGIGLLLVISSMMPFRHRGYIVVQYEKRWDGSIHDYLSDELLCQMILHSR